MSGEPGPWPPFDIEISALARTFGCEARRIEEHADLLRTLDEVLPGLASRESPLLIEAVVEPDPTFEP